MGINRVEAFKSIFNIIDDYVSKNIDREIPRGIRYINLSDKDKTFLNKAKIIKNSNILSSIRICLFKYEDEVYLTVIGDVECIDNEEHVMIEELTAGKFIFCVVNLELSLNKNANYNEMYNDLLYQHIEENYNGHEYTDISKFFPKISIYKVNSESNFIEGDIYNIFSYYMTLDTEYRRLIFEEETLEEVVELVLSGKKTIPYHNISQAIISSQWSHAFLETYRCIEQMFHVVMLKSFYENLKVENTLLEVSEHIESCIGWKPKEDSAIKLIFNMMPQEIEEEISAIKNSHSDSIDTNTYSWYYNIRNSIAHFRPIHKPIILNNNEWNCLVRSNLKIIRWLYDEYSEVLE